MSIKQSIEALDGLLSDPGPDYIKSSKWDKARAALAALRSMPAPVDELEELRLEAVAEGFESIPEYVANLRTSASTYFAERNSARDVARKHRKTIEAFEAGQPLPFDYMIRAWWPDGIEQYLDVRGVYQLSGLKVGIDVNAPDGHPLANPPTVPVPLSDETIRLAKVALHEMPRSSTDWHEAAKRVCTAVVALANESNSKANLPSE